MMSEKPVITLYIIILIKDILLSADSVEPQMFSMFYCDYNIDL